MAEWYYIGHYGQLGPLTLEQLQDLVAGNVVERSTYVWKPGMPDWVPAAQVTDLSPLFSSPAATPPPPPPTMTALPPTMAMPPAEPPTTSLSPYAPGLMAGYGAVSDRSRALGGVLQILIPGVGRLYLGYSAIGITQLLLSFCFIGWIWSVIDGIIILTGGVGMDGYGRKLRD